MIDFIFVKDGPIEVASHGVVSDTFGGGRQLSDHRPVVADITVRFLKEEEPRVIDPDLTGWQQQRAGGAEL